MTRNKSNHPWSVAIVQAMKLKAAREVGRRMREAKGETGQ